MCISDCGLQKFFWNLLMGNIWFLQGSWLLCEVKGVGWCGRVRAVLGRGWEAWCARCTSLLACLQGQGERVLPDKSHSWDKISQHLKQVRAGCTAKIPALNLESKSNMVFTPFFTNWCTKKEWQWWQPHHEGSASMVVVKRMLKISILSLQWRSGICVLCHPSIYQINVDSCHRNSYRDKVYPC